MQRAFGLERSGATVLNIIKSSPISKTAILKDGGGKLAVKASAISALRF